MDRQVFLDELKSHLKVLQDEEQEDILDEYLQHIEMKIKDGQEEEEAIKDFGPVQELAAEILEAYHVKPDFDQEMERGRGRSRKSLQRVMQKITQKATQRSGDLGPDDVQVTGRKVIGTIGCCIKKAVFRIAGAGKKAGVSIGRGVRAVFRLIGRPFRKMGGGTYRMMEQESRGPVRRMAGRLCRWTEALIRGSVILFFWCCRAAWNCMILLATAFSAGLGLVFLFLLGMLTVLLFQGYPFGGIVLGCLGAVVCCASLTVFCCTCFVGRAASGRVERAVGEKPDIPCPTKQEEGSGDYGQEE